MPGSNILRSNFKLQRAVLMEGSQTTVEKVYGQKGNNPECWLRFLNNYENFVKSQKVRTSKDSASVSLETAITL